MTRSPYRVVFLMGMPLPSTTRLVVGVMTSLLMSTTAVLPSMVGTVMRHPHSACVNVTGCR